MGLHLRRHLRLASFIGAASLSVVAISPAVAATTVSQSGANAVDVKAAGQDAGNSGIVEAKNDGSSETKTGETSPPVSILKGQKLLDLGVLAQEATAQSDGSSAACAGIAGNGGSVAQIGDSSCLVPGQPVGLSVTNLDLSGTLVIDPESALGPLAQANAPLAAVLGQITKPLAKAVADTPLGETGLNGTVGAIEGRCTAEPGTASGEANIVDGKLILTIAKQELVIANLPAKPGPNTHVPVELDKASAVILGAVQEQLRTMLAADGTTGPLAPLGLLPKELQDKVIAQLADATRDQVLQPLQDNVLDLVLNEQSSTGPGNIKVTAFHLNVLPAAKEQVGASAVELRIGNVACGPNGSQAAPAKKKAVAKPSGLPTAVSAGYDSTPGASAPGNDSHNGVVLGAFAIMLAGATGLAGFRKLRG